jgi:hypothetical protein
VRVILESDPSGSQDPLGERREIVSTADVQMPA